ncbi:6,7,8-trihydroxycoumarin synthase-like [Apium graveolens]|uniref:6,7,8-trihydroxycoumarin synthase-like n=1 Tax=Apium graveolens TaxID=4045 RepID=UPI003D78BEFE
MVVVLLFIILTFLLFFICKQSNQRWIKSNSRPPGPRGLPLIGNMHQFDTSNTHLYLLQLSRKYGPLVSLQLGSVRTLVISSATVAKEVFKNHDITFSSRPALVGTQKLSYNGIDFAFAPYSDYWRNMRKICTIHLLSTKSFQSFCPIREDEVTKMMKKLSNRAAGFNIVNVSETVMTVTSSIVYRTSFGKIDDEDDDQDYTGYNNKMSRQIHWVLTESQACFGRFFVEDFFPQLGSFIDKLCGSWTRLEKSFNKLDAFYQQVIDRRLNESTASAKECSILDILLQMKMDSSDFTFDHIKAVLMDILLAASETSAAAVIWAMTLLVKNPKTMKKVQQEVRELIGKKGFVDENDTQQLDYLKAVIKEAMRLHPPVPVVPRATMKKCVVSGYEIEDKTRVYVNLYAIGRDPAFWENPDEFIPERFLNSSIDIKGQDFELIPFGVGRRMCPGLTMGLAMTELVLANLLYHFNWELPPGVEITDIDMATLPGLTTQKKNDLCLVPVININ